MSRQSRRWLLLPLLACTKPPPQQEPTEPAVVEEPEPEPEAEPYVEHTVAAGQTLWDIARSYDKSVDEILEFNEMTHRDVRRLSKGRVLRIPGVLEAREVRRAHTPVNIDDLPELEDGAYHLLAEGETLWDLAHTYDQTVGEILERNQFTDEDVRLLRPGRAVIIPGVRQRDIRVAESAAESRGMRHRVNRGETIWDLARSFRVSVTELLSANHLSPTQAAQLREGDRLWIPGAQQGESRSQQVERRLNRRQRNALARAQRLGIGTLPIARDLLRGRVSRRWIRAAGGDRLPGTLRWPVTNGRFVRGYGSGEGGYHLAVDIAGDMGWNVRASAPGIVAYSGDEVPGYGNMVLLIHPGGWVTMYAHNSINFVVAGERVPAGAVLAELGSTGISRGPHVHFELMFEGRNCDPATLFRPGVRHASRLAKIPRQTWRRPDAPPEDLSCNRRRRHPRSRWVVNE